jgi:hypothetical protein
MTTVDNLLLTIANATSPSIEEQVTPRDAKILRSLVISASSHAFLTENQSNLLLKLLKENAKKLKDFTLDINSAVGNPTWSKEFRKLDQMKKFYIGKNSEQDPLLVIEFSFNARIRKILSGLYRSLDGLSLPGNAKINTAELTERNIVVLYEELAPLEFEIDETIQEYYTLIKSWNESEIKDQFLISNITHKNFHQAITDDLGINTKVNQNILNDRSVRYQCHIDGEKNQAGGLIETLANRSRPRVWINKNKTELDEVISALISLHRLPLLVVFDGTPDNKFLERIELLSSALENNGIYDKIGVFFRLNNDESGQEFNRYIATKGYNYNLCKDSQVAVLMNGKLPKFFLKTAWQPMSVIALDTKMGLRHGKTSVYSNKCDLVIEWSDKEVLFEKQGI